jgi:hypothetical protein
MIGSWKFYSSLIEFSARYGTKELLSDEGDKRRVPLQEEHLRPREGIEQIQAANRKIRRNTRCMHECCLSNLFNNAVSSTYRHCPKGPDCLDCLFTGRTLLRRSH